LCTASIQNSNPPISSSVNLIRNSLSISRKSITSQFEIYDETIAKPVVEGVVVVVSDVVEKVDANKATEVSGR